MPPYSLATYIMQEAQTSPSTSPPLALHCDYDTNRYSLSRDDARETIGVFMCKGTLRQEENQYLELPPEVAKAQGFSPQLLRLLGYGLCPPALGLYKYKDPMEEIFNVLDAETIRR